MATAPDLDVAVIGLGTMGSMTLWQLSRRPGLRVAGFEQYGLGHPHGAFAGESRLFRAAYHEGARYVPMLQRARELWIELGRAAGEELFLPTGTLSVGRQGDAPMRNVRDSVDAHGLPHEVLDADALRRRYPQFAVGDEVMAVLDLLGGALRPERAVLAALRLAQRGGAAVYDHAAVLAVERTTDGSVRIRSDAGETIARHVIVTTGSWAARLDPELTRKVQILPLLLTWFVPEEPAALADYLPDRFPTFIRDEGGVHVFGAPSLDGYTVKVSPSRVLTPVPDPGSFPLRVDAPLLSDVGASVKAFFPGLHAEPVRYSVHPDAYAADKVPIIDRSPDGAVVTMTGFSGHGFKFSPLIGEMGAALALDGAHALYDEGFATAAHEDLL